MVPSRGSSRRFVRCGRHVGFLFVGLAACASMSRGQGPSSAAHQGAGSGDPSGGATGGEAVSGVATPPPAAPLGGGTAETARPVPVPSGGGVGGGPPTSLPTSPPTRPPASAGAAAADRLDQPTRPDPGAEADFAAARTEFDRGNGDSARAALEAFIHHHSKHPSRPTAEILLGRLALRHGDVQAAKKWLEPAAQNPPDSGTGASARYYLGLAELRLGHASKARELLLPFLSTLPRAGSGAGGAGTGDDRAVELRGALAEATSGIGDPVAALELWEDYFRMARESERAWARSRAMQAAGQLAPEIAWRAYGAAPPQGLTRAVLGAKAAAHLRAKGDAAGAGAIEMETALARRNLGFDVSTARVGPGDPTRIGLALPLSGKFQLVGEAALRAAMLAGDLPARATGAPVAAGGGAGAASPTQLVVRDTATDPTRAAQGITELTRSEAVIGIVGTATAKTGAAAVTQASQDGIALLTLDDSAPGALTTAFQMVHPPELRAAALARQAHKQGARRFALLGPDSAAGKRLRDAFRKEVSALGGTIVAESTYVAGATSFSNAIAALKKSPPDAVFVPDSAERLELIAPALAVADLWPQPFVKGRSPRAPTNAGAPGGGGRPPRAILLLSTANELSSRLVQNAGRYTQGALLCPGFYASSGSARGRDFVSAYRAAYGQDPHATEAYAHDAVAALRVATAGGAKTRGDVIKALASAGKAPVVRGLTGDLTFGPDHARVDLPLVYTVEGEDIRELP